MRQPILCILFSICMLFPSTVLGSSIDSLILNCPLDTVDGRVMYRYTVEKSIGLFRISQNFGVSQDDIIQANPILKQRGLHVGEVIYIPAVIKPQAKQATPSSLKEAAAPTLSPSDKAHATTIEPSKRPEAIKADPVRKSEAPIIEPSTPQEHETASTISDISALQRDSLALINDSSALHIALLLPFQVHNEKRDQHTERFMEFYEGCLLAARSLQKEGRPIVLDVIDTEKHTAIVRNLVDSNRLQGTHAIIGLAYPKQLIPMADWTISHQVPIFAPFIGHSDLIETHPYLYLFNASAAREAEAIGDWLQAKGDSVHCVFIEANEANIPQSIRLLQEQIKLRQISYSTTTIRHIFSDSLSLALREDKENIIIFNTEKFGNIQVLLPKIQAQSTTYAITLFGQYAWTRESLALPLLYTSIFDAAPSAQAEEYEALFHTYFGHKHVSKLPRYDLLGYDIMRASVGILTDTIYPGLQSDIRFEHYSDSTSGYINTHISVIHTKQTGAPADSAILEQAE